MTALLYTDLCMLKKQTAPLFLMLAVWGATPNLYLNVFAIAYGAVIPYTAMTYDEQSHWNQLCPMFPYSARETVLSKYVLGWGMLALTFTCTGAVRLFCAHLPGKILGTFQAEPLFIALCLGLVLLSVNLPLLFRFGTVKGRLILFFVIATLGGGCGAISILGDGLHTWSVGDALAFFAFAAICTAVSIPLSIRMYLRRMA